MGAHLTPPTPATWCRGTDPKPQHPDPLLQGYTTRDRRRAHVREADEAADAVLAGGAGPPHAGAPRPASADGSLVEDDGGGGGAAGGGGSGGGAVGGLFKQETEFSMLVQAGRLLLQQGRLAEAKALMESSIRLFAK